MAKTKVKLVRVGHGLLGNPNNGKIERVMRTWLGKGYRLDKQQDQRGGCFRWGYTLLTFIQD